MQSRDNPDRVRGQSRDADNKNPSIIEWEEVDPEEFYGHSPTMYDERHVELSPEEERVAQEKGEMLAAATFWALEHVVAPWWKQTAWPHIKDGIKSTLAHVKDKKNLNPIQAISGQRTEEKTNWQVCQLKSMKLLRSSALTWM